MLIKLGKQSFKRLSFLSLCVKLMFPKPIRACALVERHLISHGAGNFEFNFKFPKERFPSIDLMATLSNSWVKNFILHRTTTVFINVDPIWNITVIFLEVGKQRYTFRTFSVKHCLHLNRRHGC